MKESRINPNKIALKRILSANPVLVDVKKVKDIPGYEDRMILTSGPPLDWSKYEGGQRMGILYAAIYEGLAQNIHDAEKQILNGKISIAPCHEYQSVGSLAGLYTASMPVLVVEDTFNRTRSFCTLYEGKALSRLNYGCYNNEIRERLKLLEQFVGPALHIILREGGGISLKPIMSQALAMGDELHSHSSAASLIFSKLVCRRLLESESIDKVVARKAATIICEDQYFFLRLTMAACKAASLALEGIEDCSVVTVMAYNCHQFGLQVAGLPKKWFFGPHGRLEATLFDGYSEDDIAWMGGDSIIAETMGLGAFSQAASPYLARTTRQSWEKWIQRNESLYKITIGKHINFRIPALNFRGAPVGIDIFKVVNSGLTPPMHIGIPGRKGGQIGAGTMWAPFEPFIDAAKALRSY
jgi:hypothetical protein